MNNANLGSWSSLDGAGEENGTENGTGLPNSQHGSGDIFSRNPVTEIIISVFILVISIFGLMGNGTVIWFLGFCMKRNHFTTFILNLAAADLGTLICLFPFSITSLLRSFSSTHSSLFLFLLFGSFPFFFMYNTGQYLLTAISIDRCISIVFPLWHRCRRPPHLSTIACALIWLLSFLLISIEFILSFAVPSNRSFLYILLLNAVLSLPLMTVSTLVLFIKVWFRSQQRKKRKALTAILLALLFFLFLTFPFTFILLIHFFTSLKDYNGLSVALFWGLLCSCLNSSINPLIYFLIGRNKRAQSRESMKVILQRLFKEEEDSRERGSGTNPDVMILELVNE